MRVFLNWAGHLTAVVGLVLCLVAGVTRLLGNYHALGYESMTLFIAGIGLMVAACLAKLEKLSMSKP
ncbi:MAG TPA: hypothetical protein VJO34_06005 [Methylomirabilota bacterium]|nr:hypothetical protein [Methylomirabilota bacterium]